MSSGWERRSVFIAPVPPGWKLCFSSSPKTIWFAVSTLGGALGVALALGELELEHPAMPSSPAATTVAPIHVAVRRLKMFTRRFVRDPGDWRRSGVQRAVERRMAKRGPHPKRLVMPHSCRPDTGIAVFSDSTVQPRWPRHRRRGWLPLVDVGLVALGILHPTARPLSVWWGHADGTATGTGDRGERQGRVQAGAAGRSRTSRC